MAVIIRRVGGVAAVTLGEAKRQWVTGAARRGHMVTAAIVKRHFQAINETVIGICDVPSRR